MKAYRDALPDKVFLDTIIDGHCDVVLSDIERATTLTNEDGGSYFEYDNYRIERVPYRNNLLSDVSNNFIDWINRAKLLENNVTSLDELKLLKIREMSSICESTVKRGVDIVIGGEVQHFSLSEKDQINMLGKQIGISSGLQSHEYHSDGNDCVYYNSSDMQLIITTAMGYVSYHTTYFNSLRKYIRSMESIDDVTNVYYGIEIPDEYVTEVLADYMNG